MSSQSNKDHSVEEPTNELEENSAEIDARETIEFQVSDKNFQLLRSLGNGKFGKVCLARKLDGIDRGQLYAIKVMRKNMFAVMELNKMKQITGKSPHFLTLFYAFETKKEYCQVMNFCQGGDLKNFAEKFSPIPEDIIKHIAIKIYHAIFSLHQLNLFHCDIKLSNIMITAEGEIVLVDFGMCRSTEVRGPPKESFWGTRTYVAPEVVANSHYCPANDYWALGICISRLFADEHPFNIDNRCDVYEIRQRLQSAPKFSKHISEEGQDLMRCLLTKIPEDRIQWVLVNFRTHKFFQKLSKSRFSINRDLRNDMDLRYFKSRKVPWFIYDIKENLVADEENAWKRDSQFLYVDDSLRKNPKDCPTLKEIFKERNETNRFYQKYKLSTDRPIGYGKHFLAFKCCINTDASKVFCVKIAFLEQTIDERKRHQSLQLDENILTRVVVIMEIFDDDRFSYIVTELMEGCHLLERIYTKNRITECEARMYFKQILEATLQLEDTGLIHYKLLPQKIMFKASDSNSLKLINNTSVRCQGNETDSFVPFSLGVILYTMLCQRSPFFDTNHEEPGARIDIKCKEFERLGVDAQDYLKELFGLYGGTITIDEISEHIWLERMPELYSAALVQDVHIDIEKRMRSLFETDKILLK